MAGNVPYDRSGLHQHVLPVRSMESVMGGTEQTLLRDQLSLPLASDGVVDMLCLPVSGGNAMNDGELHKRI